MSAPDDRTDLDPETRLALATWPQIDPAVESIVNRIGAAYRLLDDQMRDSLGHVGLTKEEFKVLITLYLGPRTHGALCRELHVSTGAMTNRLDKLERAGLIERSPDPADRRGVVLSLTAAGHAKLDDYIELGAARERTLLSRLSPSDKGQLNQLLAKLLKSLHNDFNE